MSDRDLSLEAHKELLESFIGALPPTESVLHLFNFLHARTPLSRIFCFHINRAKRVMNIFIDYSPYAYMYKHRSLSVRNLLPLHMIQSIRRNARDGIFLEGDTKKNAYTWSNVKNFPCMFRSYMALMLHPEGEEKDMQALMVVAEEPDAFTGEHLALFAAIKDALIRATADYFVTRQESSLALSTGGPLSSDPESMIRRCTGLAGVLRRVDAVASSHSTVLINGPTGAGKEIVADAIHALSARANAPFIKVNCGAIPETLLDSEFFGADKGAFTGAVGTRRGYFEQAHGGSIYLDEIGELTLSAQVRLLRVLESREIRRVGGVRRIPVDVRVIAATHRDLWDMVGQGHFREDLCYRLHVVPLYVPPLAERREDIPVLAKYFYGMYVKELELDTPPRLTQDAIQELMDHPWPGNVRQLRYAIERALVLHRDADELRLDETDILDGMPPRSCPAVCQNPPQRPPLYGRIREALARSGGKIEGRGGAAEILDMRPSTLRDRMRAFSIPLPRQRKNAPHTGIVHPVPKADASQ